MPFLLHYLFLFSLSSLSPSAHKDDEPGLHVLPSETKSYEQTETTGWLSGWRHFLTSLMTWAQCSEGSDLLSQAVWHVCPIPSQVNKIRFLIKQRGKCHISVQSERDHFFTWDMGHPLLSLWPCHSCQVLSHQPRSSEPKHWRDLRIWKFGNTDSGQSNLPWTCISSSLNLYTY